MYTSARYMKFFFSDQTFTWTSVLEFPHWTSTYTFRNTSDLCFLPLNVYECISLLHFTKKNNKKKKIALYKNVKVLEDLKAKSDKPDKIKLSDNSESEELIEYR